MVFINFFCHGRRLKVVLVSKVLARFFKEYLSRANDWKCICLLITTMNPTEFNSLLESNSSLACEWESPPIYIPVCRGIKTNTRIDDFDLTTIIGTSTPSRAQALSYELLLKEGLFLVDCVSDEEMRKSLYNACKKAGFEMTQRDVVEKQTKEHAYRAYLFRCNCGVKCRTDTKKKDMHKAKNRKRKTTRPLHNNQLCPFSLYI